MEFRSTSLDSLAGRGTVCACQSLPWCGCSLVTAGRSCAAVAMVPCCHGKMPCPCAGDLLVAATLHVCDKDVGPVKGAPGPLLTLCYATGKQRLLSRSKIQWGPLLMAQRHSVCLQMQETWVRSLIQDAPLALEKLTVSLGSQAWELLLLKPPQPRARALQQEKPRE